MKRTPAIDVKQSSPYAWTADAKIDGEIVRLGIQWHGRLKGRHYKHKLRTDAASMWKRDALLNALSASDLVALRRGISGDDQTPMLGVYRFTDLRVDDDDTITFTIVGSGPVYAVKKRVLT